MPRLFVLSLAAFLLLPSLPPLLSLLSLLPFPSHPRPRPPTSLAARLLGPPPPNHPPSALPHPHAHPWLQSTSDTPPTLDPAPSPFLPLLRARRPSQHAKAHLQPDASHALAELAHWNAWALSTCSALAPRYDGPAQATTKHGLPTNYTLFVALIAHDAQPFVLDQAAAVLALATALGPDRLFLSILHPRLSSGKKDPTAALIGLIEPVLRLLAIPFRIRHLPPTQANSTGSTHEEEEGEYYPAQEARWRNAVLEPLHELRTHQRLAFTHVLWLKGFTCPHHLLRLLRTALVNRAQLACGSDWIQAGSVVRFGDPWRSRAITGDLFRTPAIPYPPLTPPLSQSHSHTHPIPKLVVQPIPDSDPLGQHAFTQSRPVQVFCCESGPHVVSAELYYQGLNYTFSPPILPLSSPGKAGLNADWKDIDDDDDDDEEEMEEEEAEREQESNQDGTCRDSTQMHFCRQLWSFVHRRKSKQADLDVPQQSPPEEQEQGLDVARILLDPPCITTYTGRNHTNLVASLSPPAVQTPDSGTIERWAGPPESYICQEMTTAGGRKASKRQRRLPFALGP